MILLIDNYDSFTYNLYQYVEELGARCEVVRNDAITVEEIRRRKPKGLLLSPGPGSPKDAGITLEVLRSLHADFPIFGVCLGHQSIGEAFGGKVVRAQRPRHGKLSEILHDGKGLFAGVPNPFPAARYHSLVLEEATLPSCLQVTARTKDGTIMGVRHKKYAVSGVQFHPESHATEGGKAILRNFLLSAGVIQSGSRR